MGAGGAARAIAYEANLRGANVTIINRTFEKAKQLADNFSLSAMPLNSIEKILCDCLINTVPETALPDILNQNCIKHILSQQPLIMNINHACKEGPLAIYAKQYAAKFIDGKPMYESQAILQHRFWNSQNHTA
jgi:3-dehydroquinate dehydratase/shikimate dehydrogenase